MLFNKTDQLQTICSKDYSSLWLRELQLTWFVNFLLLLLLTKYQNKTGSATARSNFSPNNYEIIGQKLEDSRNQKLLDEISN